MPLSEPPPTAIQNLHDETPKFKIVRKNDQYHQLHQREHWIIQKSYSPHHKNKKQESISDLVMLTNTKNDSVNNNVNHVVNDGNVKKTQFSTTTSSIQPLQRYLTDSPRNTPLISVQRNILPKLTHLKYIAIISKLSNRWIKLQQSSHKITFVLQILILSP